MSMHMYTGSKGDPLCPLGFHPQVRWPTRCKRCFRDYKEHGGKSIKDTDSPALRKDDVTMSTPSLSSWGSTLSRGRDEPKTSPSSDSPSRTTTSKEETPSTNSSRFGTSRTSSWTSTPDLTEAETPTVSITLPRRRATADMSSSLDAATRSTEFTVRRRTSTSDLTKADDSPPSNRSRFKALEVKTEEPKSMRAKTPSYVPPSSRETTPPKTTAKLKVSSSTNTTEHLVKRPPVESSKKVPTVSQNSSKPPGKLKVKEPEIAVVLKVNKAKEESSTKEENSKKASQLLRQATSLVIPPEESSNIRSTSSSSSSTEDSTDDDDASSTTGTETTDTTIVNTNESELQEEIDSLKQELETVKTRCEKAEREKSDILLRRLASYDTTPTKNTTSEVLKLQQKVNELTTQVEDLRDDKKSLSLRVKELESDLDKKKSEDVAKKVNDLQGKLTAAETLCEELMDENEDMKKELRDLEEEIDEMRDNFREDQAEEYSSIRKELQQTTKNCRILSFKLRKSERRTDELETEKVEVERRFKELAGGEKGIDLLERVKKLEADLKVANEVASRLTRELDEANSKLKEKPELPAKKKAPLLSSLAKNASGEKVSRASLTRGGSQEDPQQLLRDLQDSMEREADLREQLRFAEEEASALRKKSTRVEEDNDSLSLQLKKMATKAKSRRNSPSPGRLSTPEPFVEKDEGIAEEEDPAELRLMLELNEQETGVLRKKVEELETDLDSKKQKLKDTEEQLSQLKATKKPGLLSKGADNVSPLDKQKIKVIEEECGELRKKLIEKERENERLQNEVTLSQKKKGTLVKSKSLDSGNEQQALDLKRQLQLVEQETAILRTKTQTLESENEKLSAENKKLQLLRAAKKLGNLPESEMVEKTVELEKKLSDSEKTIKQLSEKLEKAETSSKKVTPTFGKSTELEKVKTDLKSKTEEMEKISKEYERCREALRRLEEDSAEDIIKAYKARTPKRPNDMSTKLQMKKMVDELESEIGEILVAFAKHSLKSENIVDNTLVEEKNKLNRTIEEKEKQIKTLDEKLKLAEATIKIKVNKEVEFESANKTLKDEVQKLKKTEMDKKALESEKKKLQAELQKLQKEQETWKTEKKKLEDEIVDLNNEKKNSVLAQDEVAVFVKKLDNLSNDLEKERITVTELKEDLRATEALREEKAKMQKEISERNRQILELNNKCQDTEKKLKALEKSTATNKSKITKLEKTIEDQETLRAEREERWKTVQDELAGQEVVNKSLQSKISELEQSIEKKNEDIKTLEDSVRKERERATDANIKAGSAEKREITSLRAELSQKIKELEESTRRCEELERSRKSVEDDKKRVEVDLKKDNEDLEKKLSDLEGEISAGKKEMEKLKTAQEKELKNKEREVMTLKVKIKSLEQSSGDSSQRVAEVREEFTARVKKLEGDLSRERQEYEDLTVKYELLEEEHVVTKAQMVMEKEKVQSQLITTNREAESLSFELKTLKDTFAAKQDTWIKEKLNLQEEINVIAEKMSRAADTKLGLEKGHLSALLQEQQSIAAGFKQRNEAMEEQMEFMRKENEEMRRKLNDFEKVEKIQGQIASEADQLSAELREASSKLAAEEKNHKAEMAAQKLRYESRVNLISEELQSSQGQMSRFKRERDAFRHMLEEAQTQMADLKSGKQRLSSASGDEEEAKEQIAALEQQLSVMEDELSEARLEASKLRTELVSDKSAWEVKVSELQSKVNALEEDKILASGRTKIPGLRTRMELAWAKEREDQHRLLQETSTLARDLRQTLFEVERERDKERLEAKRRTDTLKKSTDEEIEENRKKITELQCDLLELRDAHSKLRTTNEKLRREKERGDRAKDREMRAKRTDDDERKISAIMDQVDMFMRLLPQVLAEKASHLELPAAYKVRAREPSPLPQGEDSAVQLQLTMQRLHQAVVDLKIGKDDDRSRRSASIGFGPRRAGSTEPDSESSSTISRGVQRKPSLYRKSLSLSETAGPNDQAIWKDDQEGSLNSLQSLEDHVDNRLANLGRREASMDSRLSGGSTQSELTPGEQKRKKGLLGKLKRLGKSKSEDKGGSQESMNAFKSNVGSDSDMSTAGDDVKGSKKDLKDRISGMFKKGTSSRGNSAERLVKPEEGSKTLPRSNTKPSSKAPAVEKSATLGRSLDRAKNPISPTYKRP